MHERRETEREGEIKDGSCEAQTASGGEDKSSFAMKMDREIRVRKQGSPLNSPVLLFHSLLWFQDVDPVDLLISSHSTDSSRSSSHSHTVRVRDRDMERQRDRRREGRKCGLSCDGTRRYPSHSSLLLFHYNSLHYYDFDHFYF